LQLIQQEKLSSLGQLVAGVAHEINNPLSFVIGNIAPAKEYLAEIAELLNLYQVIKNYGNLPDVECYPGPMNQVFMNLFANAIAIALGTEESAKAGLNFIATETRQVGTIDISTGEFTRLVSGPFMYDIARSNDDLLDARNLNP
jgi:signal transduction histidine kinase